ncbi:SCO2525 family SAM-dependent methyltransferase [Streptomyces sp. NBC_01635]|uniref:SCO2525 family SAM-dependent methyltransferase n=1 Tax=Streptomyces sp. NBC_01635 TaxID=2975904 RepID=UPI003867E701|nr:SCO2525 family SAM-dependent methyltransferase [Streptomyces sp. NBC_01635]
MIRNADAPWSAFAPDAYIDINYRISGEADLEIVRLMRDHFSRSFGVTAARSARGVDVGAGPNLYPALAMLPWCDKITLLEYALPNIAYLERQASDPGFDAVWDAFWEVLSKDPAYQAVEPRKRFGEIVRVERANLFDLEGWQRWGMGTMCFVAESMTECPAEFERGVRTFMNILEAGAPFAAAFMKESQGYIVNGIRYPAFRVAAERVEGIVGEYAEDLVVHDLQHTVREGHEGMLLALGRRKSNCF